MSYNIPISDECVDEVERINYMGVEWISSRDHDAEIARLRAEIEHLRTISNTGVDKALNSWE